MLNNSHGNCNQQYLLKNCQLTSVPHQNYWSDLVNCDLVIQFQICYWVSERCLLSTTVSNVVTCHVFHTEKRTLQIKASHIHIKAVNCNHSKKNKPTKVIHLYQHAYKKVKPEIQNKLNVSMTCTHCAKWRAFHQLFAHRRHCRRRWTFMRLIFISGYCCRLIQFFAPYLCCSTLLLLLQCKVTIIHLC